MLKERTTSKRRTFIAGALAALAMIAALAVPGLAQATKAKIDLNTADLKTIATLPGISELMAQRIIAGRPYKVLADLSSLKGIRQSQVDALKDLVTFSKIKSVKEATTKTETQTTTKEKTVADKVKTTTTETAATKEEKELINVNKADLKTLETLPGIGPALAQKIIDARPFKSVADLEKVGGIGEAKMKDLKDLVTVGTRAPTSKSQLAPGEKLNINTATAGQLDALFGIGPVKSQAIVDYRNANGKFKTIEDIMKVKGIKEGEFAKIKDFIKIK